MDSLEIITLSEANYKTLLGKRIQIIELPSDESTISKVEAKNKKGKCSQNYKRAAFDPMRSSCL